MLTVSEIIRMLWDSQGYGNVAIWGDGRMELVKPDYQINRFGNNPIVILKPIPLVGAIGFLDEALGNAEVRRAVEESIKKSGGTVSPD